MTTTSIKTTVFLYIKAEHIAAPARKEQKTIVIPTLNRENRGILVS